MAYAEIGAAPAVVVVRQTVQDGPVLSWFPTFDAAMCRDEVISASRRGVMIHGDVYLHTIRQTWMDAAEEAHATLALAQDATHLATHSRSRHGDLLPIGLAPVAILAVTA
jgi:hypothetical protein